MTASIRDPFHEISTGGRLARREICLGDKIGNSVVLKDLGISLGHRRWEVTCHYCDKVQTRSTNQLNETLRREKHVTCPNCVRDGFAARGLEVSDKRLERVLAGGPIYTAFEMDVICDDVKNALFEEYGFVEEDSLFTKWTRGEMTIPGLAIAEGFPYSAKSKQKADDAMEDYKSDATSNERYWRRKEVDARNVTHEAKRADEIQAALERAVLAAKEKAKAEDLLLRKVSKRGFERDDAEFKDRAKGANKYLKQFVAAGGRLNENLEEVCPCGSGRVFVACHGVIEDDEDLLGAKSTKTPKRIRRSVRSSLLAYMMLGSSFHALGSGHRHGSLLRCDKLQVAMNRAWDTLPEYAKFRLFAPFNDESRKQDSEWNR